MSADFGSASGGDQISGRFSGGRFGRGPGGQDFEINLAPIIDCLTVLIAFVLVGASYLSVGILEAGVATAGAVQSVEDHKSPVQVSITLHEDHSMAVLVTGSVNRAHRISPKGGGWNHDALIDRLAVVKGTWPKLNSVVLTADNDVDYRDVIKSMEITRKAIPIVNLGGF